MFRLLVEVGGEVEASLLGVVDPSLLLVLVGQIPAAHPLLKLPQVAPQLEVLQGTQRTRDRVSKIT